MGADFEYTDAIHGITSSSALIGCIIGSAVSGFFASGLGRKNSLFLAGILFFLSALGSYYPEFLFFEHGVPSYSLLVAFNFYRVLGGIGVGLASAICPMYATAEIAPSNIRGTLVSWNQFAIIFGQLVVYFVNFLILGSHANPVIDLVNGVNQIMNPRSCRMDHGDGVASDVRQRSRSCRIVCSVGVAGAGNAALSCHVR